MPVSQEMLNVVSDGYDAEASRSHSIHADCYQDPRYLELERAAIFHRSWQFLCHEEKLREPGSYMAADIQGQSIFACRSQDGELRAFYNVCKHRGHELVTAVLADVVEGSQLAVLAAAREDALPLNIGGHVAARFPQLLLMAQELPAPVKNRRPLELQVAGVLVAICVNRVRS